MAGIVRKLVNLAILLLIANALYQFVPPYLKYQQFKDDVRDVALFSNRAPDAAIVDRVLQRAEERDIPIGRDDVAIRHDQRNIYIDVAWVQDIAFAPFYTKPWEFDVHAEAIEVLASQPGR
jgi:hypothetical protein